MDDRPVQNIRAQDPVTDRCGGGAEIAIAIGLSRNTVEGGGVESRLREILPGEEEGSVAAVIGLGNPDWAAAGEAIVIPSELPAGVRE